MSIIQEEKYCFICGTTRLLEEHHLLYGKNRKKADKLGLTVFLCREHHTGNSGVHNNHDLSLALKQLAQRKCMKHYDWSTEKFISEFGRNYL